MDLTDPDRGQKIADAKALLNTYDSDIIEWMRRDPKYCLRVQQMMDNFIADLFQYDALIQTESSDLECQ